MANRNAAPKTGERRSAKQVVKGIGSRAVDAYRRKTANPDIAIIDNKRAETQKNPDMQTLAGAMDTLSKAYANQNPDKTVVRDQKVRAIYTQNPGQQVSRLHQNEVFSVVNTRLLGLRSSSEKQIVTDSDLGEVPYAAGHTIQTLGLARRTGIDGVTGEVSDVVPVKLKAWNGSEQVGYSVDLQTSPDGELSWESSVTTWPTKNKFRSISDGHMPAGMANTGSGGVVKPTELSYDQVVGLVNHVAGVAEATQVAAAA